MASRTMKVDEAIGRLCPLQGDERPFERVEGYEATDELATFLFKDTDFHIDARIAHLLNPSSRH